MKTNIDNKVVFFTKSLYVYAFFSLFMTTVASGIIVLFKFNEVVKFYYYCFYTVYNLLFIVLLLVRVLSYKKEKRDANNKVNY